MTEPAIALQDWAAVKLSPRHTGLPMTIWITENDGYGPPAIVWETPSEPAAANALAHWWIALNREVIIAFWDGAIDFDKVAGRLTRLSP